MNRTLLGAAILLALIAQQWVAAADAPARPLGWLVYVAAAVLAAVSMRQAALAAPPAALQPQPRQIGAGQRLWRAFLAGGALSATALATHFAAADHSPLIAVSLWLAGMGLMLLAVRGWQVSAARLDVARWHRREVLMLTAILVVAAAARALWIDDLPRLIFGDEPRVGMFLRRTYAHTLPQFFRLGWNSWAVIGLSLQGIWAPLLGLNIASLRLASALYGSLAVLSTALLARELFGMRVALLAASLFAIGRAAIDFSRLGTCHAQVMLLESCAFLFAWRAVNRGRASAYLAAGISTGLCLYSYNAAYLVPLLWVAWLLLCVSAAPTAVRRQGRGIALAVLGFALSTLPWLYYVTDHFSFGEQWTQFTWLARVRPISDQFLSIYREAGAAAALGLLRQQVWLTWLGFSILPARAYGLGYPRGGMLDHVSAPLFVLGLGMALRRARHDREAFVLFWWLFTALVGGAMTAEPPAFVRMVGLLPALAILAALPLAYLLGSHDSRPTLAAATLVALLLAGAGVENWRTYFVELAARSAEETSELVHYLRHQPAGMATYVLGAEHFLHVTDDTNIQHFSFEFPDRTLRDIPEPQQFLPLAEHDGAAALILGPTQLGLSPSIKRLYPSAEFSDVLRSTNGDLLFRAVHLSRAAVAAGADEISRSRGLAARYEQSDGALLHRVDAQLNSFAVEALYKNQNPLPVMMPFVAVWSGRLKIHTPGTYQLDVVASGDYALALDGVAACGAGYVLPEEPSQCGVEIDLQRGLHRLTARWDSRHAAHNTRRIFQVYWTPPDGIREIIPSEQFLPDAFAGAQ